MLTAASAVTLAGLTFALPVAVVSIYLSARRQKRELKLIHLNQRLKDVFRIAKLAKIFEGHEDMLGMTPD
jgi:hypothetical protein